jgi:hypothetical protein
MFMEIRHKLFLFDIVSPHIIVTVLGKLPKSSGVGNNFEAKFAKNPLSAGPFLNLLESGSLNDGRLLLVVIEVGEIKEKADFESNQQTVKRLKTVTKLIL